MMSLSKMSFWGPAKNWRVELLTGFFYLYAFFPSEGVEHARFCTVVEGQPIVWYTRTIVQM